MDNHARKTDAGVRWYFRPPAVFLALLCAGPLALPLVWLSPSFKKSHKIIITAAVAALTVWLAKASVELYNLLLEELRELERVLYPGKA